MYQNHIHKLFLEFLHKSLTMRFTNLYNKLSIKGLFHSSMNSVQQFNILLMTFLTEKMFPYYGDYLFYLDSQD